MILTALEAGHEKKDTSEILHHPSNLGTHPQVLSGSDRQSHLGDLNHPTLTDATGSSVPHPSHEAKKKRKRSQKDDSRSAINGNVSADDPKSEGKKRKGKTRKELKRERVEAEQRKAQKKG